MFTIDRRQERAEPAPGQGLVYWHMLLGDHPEVVAIAQTAQQRLSRFSGLHMTPLKWLHMTTMIAGSSDEITDEKLQQLAEVASKLLSQTPLITVTFGKVLYHPEATMLAAAPGNNLAPVLAAARDATHAVTGTHGRPGTSSSWTPHLTLCYSTMRQLAKPIISALRRELPGCRPRSAPSA
jgi:2'-5' RNA ligase